MSSEKKSSPENNIRRERLKEIRSIYGLTQEEFMDEVHCTNISHYETGSRPVTQGVIEAVAKRFGIDPEYLKGNSKYLNTAEEIYEITRSVLSEQAFIEKIVRILLDALGFRIIGYTGRIKQPNCLDGLGEKASFSVEDVAIIAEKKAYYFFPEYCILDTPEGRKSCSCEVFDRFINGIPEHIKVSLNSLFKPAFSTTTQKEMLLAYITDRNNPDTILKNYEMQLEKSHEKWIETPKIEA